MWTTGLLQKPGRVLLGHDDAQGLNWIQWDTGDAYKAMHESRTLQTSSGSRHLKMTYQLKWQCSTITEHG